MAANEERYFHMTLVLGLLVGGFMGQSWIDAILKTLVFGTGLFILIYFMITPQQIELLLSNGGNIYVGIGLQYLFLLLGAILGFALRKSFLAGKLPQ